jgi:tetratricopeptide (TPR) repeat protein
MHSYPFLSLLLSLTQFAQIDGQVRDARTRGPIPLASVELSSVHLPFERTNTDTEGRFHFGYVINGRYTISVDSPEYQRSSIEIDIPADAYGLVIELARKKTRKTNTPLVVSVREYPVPKSARKEFDRARQEVKRQNCTSAIIHFEKGLRIFDGDPHAHNDLGNCYRKVGQLDRAEHSFKQARSVSNSVYVSLNLAEVYTAQKRFSEAESILREAATTEPNAGDAHYGLALVYLEQGRIDEAESSALQAHNSPHQIADVHLVLAEIYWRAKNTAQTAQQLELYLKESPDGSHSERARQVLRTFRENR